MKETLTLIESKELVNSWQTIFDPFSVNTPHNGVVQFVPQHRGRNPPGTKYHTGMRLELTDPEEYGPAWGAQFFVGLNVEDVPTYTAEQVRDFVFDVRQSQLIGMAEAGLISKSAEHGGSVRPQYGFWGVISSESPGKEESVSVVIDSLSGETKNDFIENMKLLAGEIAVHMFQKAVYLQIHRGGIVKKIICIGTKPV